MKNLFSILSFCFAVGCFIFLGCILWTEFRVDLLFRCSLIALSASICFAQLSRVDKRTLNVLAITTLIISAITFSVLPISPYRNIAISLNVVVIATIMFSILNNLGAHKLRLPAKIITAFAYALTCLSLFIPYHSMIFSLTITLHLIAFVFLFLSVLIRHDKM